jgi:hypothetical protein
MSTVPARSPGGTHRPVEENRREAPPRERHVDHMKSVSKYGLLVAVALLATAAVAMSAQAQTFNPDNTAVSGTAAFPTLDYEGTTIVCDTGTADGNTGLNSNTIPDVALAFFGNCSVAGILDATVDCVGDVSLIAQNATSNTGTVNLNSGFQCDVTTDLCVVTVAGPQTTQNGNLTLQGEGGGDPKLNADVDVAATRDVGGSELCGPESGTGNFTAQYDVTPTNISID